MKKLLALFLFSFLAVGIPASVFAASDASCDSNYLCSCTGEGSSGSISQTFTDTSSSSSADSIKTVAACANICAGVGRANGAESITYQFQCNDVLGQAVSIDDGIGTITLTASPSTTTTVDSSAIIPNLNVSIPGLDLSSAVTVDSTTGTVSSNLLGLYVAAIYRYLITATALIAVVMLMVGGVGFATARGNAKAIDKARDRISKAIIGLILVLAAYDIAFFIDPNTVQFNALQFKKVEGIALESESVELDDLAGEVPSGEAAAVGNLVKISGTHLFSRTSSGSDYIGADVLTELNAAVDKYYTLTEKNVYVSSASRTLTKQAELFYDKCLLNGGYCKPSTCDVTGGKSSVLSSVGGKYTLTGALAGVTDRTTIVTALAANGQAQNCPHTSNVAVDIWPDGSGDYKAYVKDVQNLMTVMTQNGFCRLSSEAWHYELDRVKVDTKTCSTSYDSTNIKNHSTAGCTRYDFKNFCCVVADIQGTGSPTMCTN